jgi:hypothetical protein
MNNKPLQESMLKSMVNRQYKKGLIEIAYWASVGAG